MLNYEFFQICQNIIIQMKLDQKLNISLGKVLAVFGFTESL